MIKGRLETAEEDRGPVLGGTAYLLPDNYLGSRMGLFLIRGLQSSSQLEKLRIYMVPVVSRRYQKNMTTHDISPSVSR